MSSESNHSFTVEVPNSSQEAAIAPSGDRQPMQIYRPEPSPLPGNRPIADNAGDETDELLGYLD